MWQLGCCVPVMLTIARQPCTFGKWAAACRGLYRWHAKSWQTYMRGGGRVEGYTLCRLTGTTAAQPVVLPLNCMLCCCRL